LASSGVREVIDTTHVPTVDADVREEEEDDLDLAPTTVGTAAGIPALDLQETDVIETETTEEDHQTAEIAVTATTAETATITEEADAMTATVAMAAVTVVTTEEIGAEVQMIEEEEGTVQNVEVPARTEREPHQGNTVQRERSISTTARRLEGPRRSRTQSQTALAAIRNESMRSVQQLLANLRTTSERAQSLQVNLYGEDVLHVDT